MLETKNLSNRIIQLVNEQLDDKRFQLDQNIESCIRSYVEMAYLQGKDDGLSRGGSNRFIQHRMKEGKRWIL